jgi:hypothetical protein
MNGLAHQAIASTSPHRLRSWAHNRDGQVERLVAVIKQLLGQAQEHLAHEA